MNINDCFKSFKKTLKPSNMSMKIQKKSAYFNRMSVSKLLPHSVVCCRYCSTVTLSFKNYQGDRSLTIIFILEKSH